MLIRKAPYVFVLGALTTPASATLLIYEPFDYASIGAELSDADGAGGWLKVAATSGMEPTIASGSIAYPALPFTPVGNKIIGHSEGSGVRPSTTRAIAGQPFLSANEPTLYYSLLLNVTDVAGLGSGGGSFIAGFRNNTSDSGLASSEAGAPLLLRQTGTGTGQFNLGTGLTQNNADRTWGTDVYDATTGPLLLVLAYEFVSGGADFARLYVNPDPSTSEAANASALKVSATGAPDHGIAEGVITSFFFRNNGAAPDGWEIDELRIADTWEDLWTTTVKGIWLGGVGNWSNSGMWSGGIVPNDSMLAVQIDNDNPLASTVTLDLDAAARTVALSEGDTFNIPAGRTLTLSGPGSTFSGIVNSAGTVNAPAITVRGSTAEFHYNTGGALDIDGLQLSAGGKLLMAPGGEKTLKLAGLSVSASSGSQLDVADNKLVISGGDLGTSDGTTYNGLTGLIQSGRNGGTWDGGGIITSMPDAQGILTSLGIKVADAAGTFGGLSVAAGDVLIMYTYGGDANLDGIVSGDDYTAIDFAIAVPGAAGWANGDFNYDGIISGDDYTVIDFVIAAQGAPFPTGAANALAAVPEPAALSTLALAALLARRSRRRGG